MKVRALNSRLAINHHYELRELRELPKYLLGNFYEEPVGDALYQEIIDFCGSRRHRPLNVAEIIFHLPHRFIGLLGQPSCTRN
jgi:hypothetical protein